MKVINIFVVMVLMSRKNILAEMERVSVGDGEYQCGEDGQIIKITSNFTKLSLPANFQAMYSVNTERTTACRNQQRCTLMTWKIIRELEMFLNTRYKNTGLHGVVEFKNDMIISDFNYLLHVVLKNSKGQIKEKDFNITFVRNNKNESRKVVGHLDIKIGSSFVYSSLPVIINANVTLCGNVSHYFFRWSVITLKQEIVLPDKSSLLTILPQTLEIDDEKSLPIKCLVINVENNSIILEESVKINIIDPPSSFYNNIDVILPFKYTTINAGAPISIVPYIYIPLKSDGQYKIEWSCLLENTWIYGCQGQINKEFYMETGFDQHGNYSITLKVSRGKLEKLATCNILIRIGVPSIEFNTEHPIRPEQGIKLTARVYELRTYCFVYWDSEENYLDLNKIPGFHKEIYNISSKDKTFLEEIEEFGNITSTKEFSLIIPPPSREWDGLKVNRYNLKIIVTCPTLAEINNMDKIMEVSQDFITISGDTELYISPMPRVKNLEVFSNENIALNSYYFYKVNIANDTNGPMIYKYGFILANLDVIFYLGIDIRSAKTIMPYNGEDGTETFIEVCDYQNRCGKTFGPIIKTRESCVLDHNFILNTIKQLLIEEDFYKAFSYAFIVLHSVNNCSEQTKEYNTIISSEISQKIRMLMETNYENRKEIINKFLKSLVIFLQHLELSEEVIEQLSLMTKEISTNTISRLRVPRQVSRNLLATIENNVATLEEIKNYLIASEYVILNSLNSESKNKEKDHMLNLLDGWMVLACSLLFREKLVTKIEMQTVVFSIEKISKTLLDRYVVIPFNNNNNNWNITARLKIKDMNDYSSNKLCLGKTMLRNFFSKEGIIFGGNIYSADEQLMELSISAQIRIFIPVDAKITKTMQPKCIVFKNGFEFRCSVIKQYPNFIECLCPVFGYYFVEYLALSADVEGRKVELFENISYNNFNKTDDPKIEDTFYGNVQLGQKISYVIIASSLVGFFILCYIIRKLTIVPQQNIGVDGLSDNGLYGPVMHEDLLE